MIKSQENNNFLLFTLEYPPFKGGIAQYYQNLAQYWPAGELTVLTDSILGGADTDKIKYRPLLNKYLRPRWIPALWQLFKNKVFCPGYFKH